MTHQILDKVSEAIIAALEGQGHVVDYDDDDDAHLHSGPYHTDFLAIARAAVQALLEPDEGMVAEGREICRAAYMDDRDANQANAKDVYQSMLLTVLADEWEEQIPWPKRDDVKVPSSDTFQPTPGVYETQHRRVAARGEG